MRRPTRPATAADLPRAALALGIGAAVALAPFGCARRADHATDASVAQLAVSDASVATTLAVGDARAEAAAFARARYEAGAYDGPFVGAANMVVSVLSDPVWPETEAGVPSQRLGYLRHGAKVPVVEGVLVNDECTDGWYELVQGGYVCGKAATLDLKSPRVKLAPKPPDLDAGLPYRYGYNVTNGTPVYRRVLSIDDRKKYEPWLAPKPAPESKPYDETEAPAAAPAEEEAPENSKAKRDTWFMRHDAGKADVRLGDLRGRGVLVRRMVRGFFLALDRDFKAAGAKWWRTTYGFAVPFDRVMLQPKLSDYHGFWAALPAPASELANDGGIALDADADGAAIVANMAATPRAQTFAFVTSSAAVKILVDREKNKIGWAEALPKRRAVALTGEKLTVGGVVVHATTEGFFVRDADVKFSKPSAPPADLAPGEKWIDVDLTRQMLVAFEGDVPVFGTLVSTGKRNPVDKEKDHPTPPGTYRIREKHVSTTMDGDVAADGPYSLEDVPWVMYFQGSFALHGAFWHNGFGGTRSHGCVNLAPDDARSLFAWSDPPLPPGWHGVFATDKQPGTRIVIHEDETPKKK